ncbi:MAG: glycosyltransferase [candidate division Zixibacteria bacterium]|nr:glycosyltransferase [candidate division Zixibacteria bacterium]
MKCSHCRIEQQLVRNILNTILIIFAVIYALSIIYLLTGFYRIGNRRSREIFHISTVVAAHNEEKYLEKCLQSLASQNYPVAKYEVIIADDRSNDNTPRIIKNFCDNYDNFKSTRVEIGETAIPKKTALQRALEMAKGEIIVSTDADCEHHENWMQTLVSHFDDKVGIVIGHAAYSMPGNLWQGIDALDYFSQRALGAAFAGVGSSYTCTAANLAYRRSIYEEFENDFKGLKVRPAEDNFIVNYVHHKTGYKIAVATEQESIVETNGAQSFGHFFNQRFRWGAYGESRLGTGVLLFFIPTLLFYGLITVAAISFIITGSHWNALLIALSIKLIADFAFLYKAAGVYHCKYLMKYFPPSWLFNLILVPLIIVKSNLSTFKWKDKKYTQTAEVET